MNRINCTTAKKKDDNLSQKNPTKILIQQARMESTPYFTHTNMVYILVPFVCDINNNDDENWWISLAS